MEHVRPVDEHRKCGRLCTGLGGIIKLESSTADSGGRMFFDDLLDGSVHKGCTDPPRELIINRINSGEEFYDALTGEGG